MNLRRRALLLSMFLAACSAAPSDDADEGGAEADVGALGDYRTVDAANPWTKGVDLAKLGIGGETVLPDEESMFAQMAKDIESMQNKLERINGGKARGFHAKSHACVKGELHVEVPASLARARVGLFATKKTYPTWIRYSNGTGFVQADRKGDVRGLGIKVMKVGDDATTQDFLMTNGATTPASDSKQFVEFGKALVSARVNDDGSDVGVIEGLLKSGGWLLKSENKRVRDFLLKSALPRVVTRGSMLAEQFWTGGAIAMGVDASAKEPRAARAKQAAKLTALPGIMAAGRCVPIKKLPNLLDKNYFKTDIRDHMRKEETCLDLQIQFQNDSAKQPMEDTSVEWREAEAPFTSIGWIQVPKTDLTNAAEQKKEDFCNTLSFTPWHAMPEHRPLGNIMRARRAVYAASAANRGGAKEPTGDESP